MLQEKELSRVVNSGKQENGCAFHRELSLFTLIMYSGSQLENLSENARRFRAHSQAFQNTCSCHGNPGNLFLGVGHVKLPTMMHLIYFGVTNLS